MVYGEPPNRRDPLTPFVTIRREEYERLQRELAEAREELAAWRKAGETDKTSARRRALQTHFDLTAMEGAMLERMLTGPGTLRLDQLLDARPTHRHREPSVRLVTTKVSHLRVKLRRRNLGSLIETVWGVGYVIARPAAAAIEREVFG